MKFFRKTKITHSNRINSQDLERLFYATNFEEVEQEYNDNKALMRYEFFEILVRIAHYMFVKTGELSSDSNSRALHRLINEHILPFHLIDTLTIEV